MFGYGKPQCPVGEPQRAWFESSAQWLVDAFGDERIRAVTVVEPEPRFFPGRFDASRESVRRLFEIVCGHMRVDPAAIDLDVYEEDAGQALFQKLGLTGSVGGHDGTAGLYTEQDRPRILIEASGRRRLPERIAATAHELGHYLLLGERRLSRDRPGGEPLTDMATAFLGMGIFGANSYIHASSWSGGGWEGWSVGALGYLDASQWAYSLALFAWLRREGDPTWARHLRGDVRTPFNRGLRFLEQSGLEAGRLPRPASDGEPPLPRGRKR